MAPSENRPASVPSIRQPPIDVATLRRLRQRDGEAMEAFFGFYFDRVFSYLRMMFTEAADADDAVQEAFLRLNRHIEKIDPEQDPTGWVFRIASNAAKDQWRARNRGARRLESQVELEWNSIAPDPAEDAQQKLEREEQQAQVQRALARLSAADREIVLLRDYQELSTPAICAILGVSADVVRQRHSRAVRRLGESFRALGNEEGGRA